MSIASELEHLAQNLANANEAIIEKGGTASTTGLSGLADAIESVPTGPVLVTGVEITSPAEDTEIYTGSPNIPLEATVTPATATNKNVTWSSSDTTKVSIVYNALTDGFEARALASGVAIITVTTEDGSFTDSVTITAKTHVTGVAISPISASPALDSTQQLTAIITPSDATDKTGTWDSDNTAVATVDSTGLVTAKAGGTATITFTTNDGGFTGTSVITPIDTPTTWTAIQSAVQAGDATRYWSVGDEINVACPWVDPSDNTEYNWVWVVADIGTTYKESAPDTPVPSMTLIAKYSLQSAYSFDNKENVTADEATAQAGVYYYGWNGSNMIALNLTTGDTIPYGDYTTIWKSSINTTWDVFDGIKQSGYNNWELSNIRQWLNSSASANSWFIPSHVGDTAPSYSSQAGFLSGFSAEFQSVLTPTRSGTTGNTVTDGGTTYYTYDKMFLPSAYEIKADTSMSAEGPRFALYANAQDSNRIKYQLNNQSKTTPWWLRTNFNTRANSERRIMTTGAMKAESPNSWSGIVPVCRIC